MNLRGNPMAHLFAKGMMYAIRIPGARLWAHKESPLWIAICNILIQGIHTEHFDTNDNVPQ